MSVAYCRWWLDNRLLFPYFRISKSFRKSKVVFHISFYAWNQTALSTSIPGVFMACPMEWENQTGIGVLSSFYFILCLSVISFHKYKHETIEKCLRNSVPSYHLWGVTILKSNEKNWCPFAPGFLGSQTSQFPQYHRLSLRNSLKGIVYQWTYQQKYYNRNISDKCISTWQGWSLPQIFEKSCGCQVYK